MNDLADVRYEKTLDAIGQLANTTRDIIAELANSTREQFAVMHGEIEDIKKGVGTVIGRLDNLPLQSADIDRITKAKNNRIVNLLGGKDSNAYCGAKDGRGKEIRSRAYSDINIQIQREFGVSSYKFIASKQTDMVIDFINKYDFPYELKEAVRYANSQTTLNLER